jgi:hypothetical protein
MSAHFFVMLSSVESGVAISRFPVYPTKCIKQFIDSEVNSEL